MKNDILLVACYIAALYDKELCPENVCDAMFNILLANDLWGRLSEIYYFEGGYEDYVNNHKAEL